MLQARSNCRGYAVQIGLVTRQISLDVLTAKFKFRILAKEGFEMWSHLRIHWQFVMPYTAGNDCGGIEFLNGTLQIFRIAVLLFFKCLAEYFCWNGMTLDKFPPLLLVQIR